MLLGPTMYVSSIQCQIRHTFCIYFIVYKTIKMGNSKTYQDFTERKILTGNLDPVNYALRLTLGMELMPQSNHWVG